MTADLSATLAVTRDLVQTFAGALSLFSEGDLHRWPGSPSAASAPVTGTRTRSDPYEGDDGLRRDVLRALQQSHDCVMTLAQLDCVTEPTAFDDGPERRMLPSMARMHAHLHYVDTSLAEVQMAIHGLAPAEREIALDACAHITGTVGDEVVFVERALAKAHPDGTVSVIKRWDRMARRARMQCADCWRLSGRADLCQECSRPGENSCRNPEQRTECLNLVRNNKRGLCLSCDQARRNALRESA